MRNRVLLLLMVVATTMAASACTAATGTVMGGQPLGEGDAAVADASAIASSNCVFDAGTPRWQDLYACYFGPGGMASCGSPTCHSVATDPGAQASNFVCGSTAASCFQGMTAPANGALAIVPAGGASSPSTTPLWSALHVSNPVGIVGNNMPVAPPYTFTPRDLANIGAWIQNGAPNN